MIFVKNKQIAVISNRSLIKKFQADKSWLQVNEKEVIIPKDTSIANTKDEIYYNNDVVYTNKQ